MAINPINHPIMFEVPELDGPSEWIEHVPFGMLLVDLIKPRSIIELGVNAGVSYCAFCQAVKQLRYSTSCFGVDAWKGDEGGGYFGDAVLSKLREHHDPRYGAFSQLIRSTFDDAASLFTDESIDLLHIDGSRTYEAVSHDLDTWLPKISNRGVVILHNIAVRRAHFGVWRAWEELSRRYPAFEFKHGQGLGLVSVGPDMPDGIRQLLDCTDEQAGAFRTMCYERGLQLRSLQGRALQTQEDAATAAIIESEREKQQLQISNFEQTIELLKMREQHAVEREQRNRATCESQMLSLEQRARVLMLEWNHWAWVESSRGVRAVKLVRASRYLLQQRGLFYTIERVLMWLRGKRGIGVSNITRSGSVRSASPYPVTLSTSMVGAARVRDQSLPTSRQFSGVSIIVPVFNALEYAQRCVASIYTAESKVPFEIVLIDSGSNANVLEWLRQESRQHDNFWYISVSANLGYARGINLGIAHARGRYVIFANSDILATSHWLDSLVAIMESHQEIGVLSPLTNYVGHGPQIDPLAENLQPDDCEKYAAMIQADSKVQVVANGLVFFCVMVRKHLAALLGGLDEGYALGNYEDDDFCIRARMAGYKLAIAKNTFVYHFGTKTFAANRIDHSSLMHQNLIRYLDRLSDMSTSLSPRTPHRVITEPLISVVVRTVDRPEALVLALTSLANQTWQNFEVVVVCDGGPDVSHLLEDFSAYLSVQYVNNEYPQGRSEALNIGVKRSRGTYITYLDDDDIIYPTHLETLIDTMMENGEATTFAYTDYNRAFIASLGAGMVTLSRVPVPTWTFRYDELLAQNYLPMHTWLHDRVLWEEVGGFDAHMDMLEDWDFLIRAAQRRNFVATKRITCEYRFYVSGSNSLIRNRSRTLEATHEIYLRYPTHATVDAQRNELLLALRAQLAEGARVMASADSDGRIPEPVLRQFLSVLAGFVE